MKKREQIVNYIEQKHKDVGFTTYSEYCPNLGFKVTNIDSQTDNSFLVDSVDEAESLVISFISTAQKGNIFVNDIYTEDKPLFLRVNVILPEPL